MLAVISDDDLVLLADGLTWGTVAQVESGLYQPALFSSRVAALRVARRWACGVVAYDASRSGTEGGDRAAGGDDEGRAAGGGPADQRDQVDAGAPRDVGSPAVPLAVG